MVGADGGELGHVNDVRVVRRPGGALPVVDGIVVGDRHAGSLLGYDRRPEQGPWLVRVVVRRLHRHACYVPWRAVTSLDLGRRILVVDARQARPLPSSEPSAT